MIAVSSVSLELHLYTKNSYYVNSITLLGSRFFGALWDESSDCGDTPLSDLGRSAWLFITIGVVARVVISVVPA